MAESTPARTGHKPSNFPYIIGAADYGPVDQSQVGGRVIRLTSASALKLGDAVFLSAALTVDKSTTASDYRKRIGIVVGGDLLGSAKQCFNNTSMIGTVCSTATTGWVFVQVSGVALCVADAAITAGARIIGGTSTAGRVKTGAILTGTGTVDISGVTVTNATSAVPATGLTIAAGGTTVTSTAANGAIVTGSATAAAQVATVGGSATATITLAGDNMNTVIGIALDSASNAGDAVLVLITLS